MRNTSQILNTTIFYPDQLAGVEQNKSAHETRVGYIWVKYSIVVDGFQKDIYEKRAIFVKKIASLEKVRLEVIGSHLFKEDAHNLWPDTRIVVDA